MARLRAGDDADVMLPLVAAVCDERLNVHGVQATKHLRLAAGHINGPLRMTGLRVPPNKRFSNVGQGANSTSGGGV